MTCPHPKVTMPTNVAAPSHLRPSASKHEATTAPSGSPIPAPLLPGTWNIACVATMRARPDPSSAASWIETDIARRLAIQNATMSQTEVSPTLVSGAWRVRVTGTLRFTNVTIDGDDIADTIGPALASAANTPEDATRISETIYGNTTATRVTVATGTVTVNLPANAPSDIAGYIVNMAVPGSAGEFRSVRDGNRLVTARVPPGQYTARFASSRCTINSFALTVRAGVDNAHSLLENDITCSAVTPTPPTAVRPVQQPVPAPVAQHTAVVTRPATTSTTPRPATTTSAAVLPRCGVRVAQGFWLRPSDNPTFDRIGPWYPPGTAVELLACTTLFSSDRLLRLWSVRLVDHPTITGYAALSAADIRSAPESCCVPASANAPPVSLAQTQSGTGGGNSNDWGGALLLGLAVAGLTIATLSVNKMRLKRVGSRG